MNVIENMDEEIRCGYKVSAARKRLWACELKLYLRFREICDKNSLRHFLIGGSAIGAVRHQGFIPWDDDIDIGMLREDFDIFVRVLKKELSKDNNISIAYGVMKDSISPLLRIRDNTTTGIICSELGSSHSKGIFIEIYVFDNVPNDDIKMGHQIDEIENLLYRASSKKNRLIPKSKDDAVSMIKDLVLSANQLWKNAETLAKSYQSYNCSRVNTVLIPEYARSGEHLIPREWAAEIMDVPFENITASVMKNNHLFLAATFGNYLELPPVGERGKHHQRVVFYDPDHPFSYYEESEIPNEFFKGDIGEII